MSTTEGYEVVMPKLGLIMTEARLVEWYKENGEWVEAGALLFVLESDKSTIEIEAPASGRVSVVVQAGETVPVMTPIAYIMATADPVDDTPVKPIPPTLKDDAVEKASKQTSTVRPSSTNNVRATPKARKIARQKRVDLANVQGSGLRGMVIVADLDRYVELTLLNVTPIARKMALDYGLDLSEVTGSGPNNRINRSDVSNALADIVANQSKPANHHFSQQETSLPLTGLRGVIAQRLTDSWRERPQVTLTVEVDATNLILARDKLVTDQGQKVSFNAFIIQAAAHTLREQPHVNVSLTESGISNHPEINIGLAVDTDRGLLVPVLRKADSKTIVDLDSELKELSQKAQAGKALPDELTGGTFTITNLGRFGIDAFTPIINPPEAAVLGVGRISPRPFAVGRQLEVRDTVTLSLSFDHRLIDGAPAARFLQRLSTLIEHPLALSETDHGSE